MGAREFSDTNPGRTPRLLHEELTATIRQTAFDVHRYFGRGFLEKVYENALRNRLDKQGLHTDTQVALCVYDEDGTVVGHYVADMLVEKSVLIEIKATEALSTVHHAQIMNYLKATKIEIGLLINFGSPRIQVKRFIQN